MKVRIRPSLESDGKGVGIVKLNDYEDFDYVIHNILLDHPYLIFRGQRDSNWPLRSGLDRLYIQAHQRVPKQIEAKYLLQKFKYSTRGRLSPAWIPNDENSWWALGQHFGLATPLLDWTESPYVAAYFSFLKKAVVVKNTYPQRIVFALDPIEIEKKNKTIKNKKDKIEIINPLLDQNPRLVSQRGLFTKLPVGVDLEKWVRTSFSDITNTLILIKIVFPEKNGDREKFLQILNRANINALSLFPDLVGASEYVNNSVLIKNY